MTRSPRRRRASSSPASSSPPSALDAVQGADAVVLVTEWPEFGELDFSEVAAAMSGDRGRRRPQLPRPRDGARGRAALRRHRPPQPRLMQALILVGRGGHAPAPADLEHPEAGRHARRPALHGLHARVARRARRGRRDHGLRLPPRQRRAVLGEGEDYGMTIRYLEEPRPLGTGGALKFAEEFLDERFLMLNGDVLTDIDLTAQIEQHERDRRVRDARAGRRSRTRATTASCAGRRRRGPRVPREARRRQRRHATRSPPAPTSSSARCSTCSSRTASLDRARGLPAPGRQRPPRRGCRGLLARHRDARALPAGDVRHPRGRRRRPRSEADGGTLDRAPASRDRRRRSSLAAVLRRRGRRSAAGRPWSARLCSTASRIGENCVLRDCIVGAGAIIGDGARVEGLAMVARARSRDDVDHRGAARAPDGEKVTA